MIGITGQIGAGKSFVGRILREGGFSVVDADQAVHLLYRDDQKLRLAVAKEFGEGALTEEGVNRKFFAELIFKDESARIRLENLVYPVLTSYIIRTNPAYVEAALFENVPDLVKLLDEIWVVTAPAELRFQRLVTNRGFSPEDARRRMELQQSKDSEESWRTLFPGKKLRFIENIGDEASLRKVLS